MKKWFSILGIIISSMFFMVTAQADVIFEPENSFYQSHASECIYVDRQFTANGPDGKVVLYESPESPKITSTWENGQQKTICFTYEDKDGVVWGVSESDGWAPMEYMQVVYDNISFMEEYKEEIKSQEGTLKDMQQGDPIYFWKYPGSEVTYEASIEESPLSYSSTYTDEQGKNWAYITYYYGHRDVWICLDQPTEGYAQVYPQGAPKKTGQDDGGGNATENSHPIKPKINYSQVAFAVVLVGIVVAVTVVLLVVLRKKRGKI